MIAKLPRSRSGLPAAAPLAVTAAAIALFSVMDALMKRASLGSGVYAALFARSVIGAAVLVPAWRLRGGRWPSPTVLRLHALRGVLAAGMAGSFFYGIVRTPLAEGIAISFVAPLLALGLAGFLLGERVRHESLVAAIIALIGVGVIAWGRLGEGAAHAQAERGLCAILLSAVLYAWNLVIQRQQAQVAGPVEVAASQNIVVALALLIAAPLGVLLTGSTAAQLLVPAASTIADIAGAAILASASLMLLAWAYARAEAQTLVPLEYTAFLWSALMGWLWFAEPVTGWTLLGLSLILAGVWWSSRTPQARLLAAETPPA